MVEKIKFRISAAEVVLEYGKRVGSISDNAIQALEALINQANSEEERIIEFYGREDLVEYLEMKGVKGGNGIADKLISENKKQEKGGIIVELSDFSAITKDPNSSTSLRQWATDRLDDGIEITFSSTTEIMIDMLDGGVDKDEARNIAKLLEREVDLENQVELGTDDLDEKHEFKELGKPGKIIIGIVLAVGALVAGRSLFKKAEYISTSDGVALRTQLQSSDVIPADIELFNDVSTILKQSEAESLRGNSAEAKSLFLSGMMTMFNDLEGHRAKSYKDTSGLTTIGVGFNMERAGAKASWNEAFAGEADCPDFNKCFSGKEKLSERQIDLLLARDIENMLPGFINRIGGQEVYDNLSVNERAGLFSLYYNNPALIGDGIRGALKGALVDGTISRDEMVDTIRKDLSHGNNKNWVHGIHNRRLMEVALWVDDGQNVTTQRAIGRMAWNLAGKHKGDDTFTINLKGGWPVDLDVTGKTILHYATEGKRYFDEDVRIIDRDGNGFELHGKEGKESVEVIGSPHPTLGEYTAPGKDSNPEPQKHR
jgi:GH24 family phage-related lysozyme (muramidase)